MEMCRLKYLSTVETAKRLAISRQSVKLMIQSGRIKYSFDGNVYRIPESEVSRLEKRYNPKTDFYNYWSVNEACKFLAVTKTTIGRYVSKKLIKVKMLPIGTNGQISRGLLIKDVKRLAKYFELTGHIKVNTEMYFKLRKSGKLKIED